MNNTWLLRPGAHLEGVRTVTTRVRPAKVAFVVPDDDRRMALRTVQSCCSAWGGYACLIVPCSRGTGLSPDWRAVLEAADPDAVVDCGVLLESEKREIEGRGTFVRGWEDAERFLCLGEALQRSALVAFGSWLEPSESDHFVVVPDVAEDDPLYLPILARWGALDDGALKRAVGRLRYEYRELPVNYSDFARLRRIDFSEYPADALLGRVPTAAADDLNPDLGLNLPDLTRIGLAATGIDRLGGITPESFEHEEGYADFVIVTGEADSVSDLALYWDLRSERPGADPFPLWVPLDMLDSDYGEALVQEAVGMTDPSIRRELQSGSRLHIVNASGGRTQLEACLSPRFPEAVIGAEQLSNYLIGRWTHYLSVEQAPVHFEVGRASVPRPRPGALDNFLPLLDRVVYEVGIEGVRLPQSDAVCDAIYGHRPNRITKDGRLEYLSYPTSRSPRNELTNLQLPDGWTVLSSLLEERGYSSRPTQKSNLALGQLSLLGGVQNLKVLASSKVHRLLKELSGRRGAEREFATRERQSVALNRFEQAWGRETGRRLLRWLVEKRVLLRGAELECSRCRLKRWYPVGRLSEVWRCDGCQEDMPIPLGLDATHWRYRVNELFAAGYDQGTVTPLLALYLMHTAWGRPSDREGFGCYPGVELIARDGVEVPVDHIEVDLVALRHGRPILVECKESGESLQDPEQASAFAVQLAGLAALAKHLGASRIVNATPNAFPEDKTALVEQMPQGAGVEVEWWDGASLLDPYPIERRRGAGWPEEYLDLILHGLLLDA
jgi:hypothetical protein